MEVADLISTVEFTAVALWLKRDEKRYICDTTLGFAVVIPEWGMARGNVFMSAYASASHSKAMALLVD